MAHVLDCRDIDFLEGPCEFRGRNEDEVVEKLLEYARLEHKIWGVVPRLREALLRCVMEEPEYW